MLQRYLVSLALLGPVLAACGGDDVDLGDITDPAGGADAGVEDDVFGDAGSGEARLQSGTYEVSNIVKISDGCNLTLEDGTFETTELLNTGTELAIGRKYDGTTDPIWDPPGYGLGSGRYTTPTTATLRANARVDIDDGACEFDTSRTSEVTFIGNDAVRVEYTDEEMNHSARCRANGLPSETCTSSYTFELRRRGS